MSNTNTAADYSTGSLVLVSGIKRTTIRTSGMWFVRSIDGTRVTVARSMFVGADECIEVDSSRCRSH